jgi:hypothetical protein
VLVCLCLSARQLEKIKDKSIKYVDFGCKLNEKCTDVCILFGTENRMHICSN